MSRKLFRALTAGVSAVGLTAYARFRREMRSRRNSVDRDGMVTTTAAGEIEYAETGEGEALLVIHGAGGGYDQGILIAEDFATGYRVIAPSRFGYLKTPVPEDHSPAAQADAHAALLDILGIDSAVVVGVSAGAPSAVEFALRHPRRISALILLVPRTFHPKQSVGADASVPSQIVMRLIETSADFMFWVAERISRKMVVRFFGVPPEVDQNASEADRARVSKLMNSVLPLSARVHGIEVDGLTKMTPWPLERIAVPTLIITARDDLYNTLPGARFTAQRISGAQLEVLSSGGHLMVGRTEEVRLRITGFLDRIRRTKPRSTRARAHSTDLERANA